MIKHQGVVLKTTGGAQPGALVYVYDYLTSAAVDLWEDDETTPKASPVASDSEGNYSFNVPAGVYTVVVVVGGTIRTYSKVSIGAEASTSDGEGSTFAGWGIETLKTYLRPENFVEGVQITLDGDYTIAMTGVNDVNGYIDGLDDPTLYRIAAYASSDIEYLCGSVDLLANGAFTLSANFGPSASVKLIRCERISDDAIVSEWVATDNHLIRSYNVPSTDPNYNVLRRRTFIYDQAVAIIAFISHGEFATAEAMMSGLLLCQRPGTAAVDSRNGQFGFGYYSLGWDPSISAISPVDLYFRTGAEMWVAYSMLHFLKLMPGSALCADVEAAVINLLDAHILNTLNTTPGDYREDAFQGGFGAYAPGYVSFDPDTVIEWCSTEHNVDAFFAYTRAADLGLTTATGTPYATVATNLGAKLIAEADGSGKGFWTTADSRAVQGITDATTFDTSHALDCGSWYSLAARKLGAVQIANEALLSCEPYRVVDADFDDGHAYTPYLAAFGYPSATDAAWIEGTAGVILARFAAGQIQLYVEETAQAMKFRNDLGFPYVNKDEDAYELKAWNNCSALAWMLISGRPDSLWYVAEAQDQSVDATTVAGRTPGAANGLATLDAATRLPTAQLPATIDATTVGGRTPAAASGLATLDSGGKVPTGQLPTAIVGSLKYKGTWNANTNTPTLGNSGAGGVAGDYYMVATLGTTSVDGITDWFVGDFIVHNGTTWDQVDNTDAVPASRAISAGSGLTGGGDLSSDRSIAADFGTGAGKVTQGNDARLSDDRTPSALSVTDAKVSATAAIALTKLANIADARILGNNAGAPGAILELTVAQVRTLLALATVATSGSGADLTAKSIPATKLESLGIPLTTLSLPNSGFVSGYDAVYLSAYGCLYCAAITTNKLMVIDVLTGLITAVAPGGTFGSTACLIWSPTLSRIIAVQNTGFQLFDPSNNTFGTLQTPAQWGGVGIGYDETNDWVMYTTTLWKFGRVHSGGTSDAKQTTAWASNAYRCTVVGTDVFGIEGSGGNGKVHKINPASWPAEASGSPLNLSVSLSVSTDLKYNSIDSKLLVGGPAGQIFVIDPSALTLSSTKVVGNTSLAINHILVVASINRIFCVDNSGHIIVINATTYAVLQRIVPATVATAAGLVYDTDHGILYYQTAGQVLLQRFIV